MKEAGGRCVHQIRNSSSIYSEINSALEMEKSDQYSFDFIFNMHSIVCFLPAFSNEISSPSEQFVSLFVEIFFFLPQLLLLIQIEV